MGSDIALNYLKKIPKKELGLGFDNLVKLEYLDMRPINIANNDFLDLLSKTKNLCLSNVNRIVRGNLNINSLPNKFNQLKELFLKYLDILDIFFKFTIFS